MPRLLPALLLGLLPTALALAGEAHQPPGQPPLATHEHGNAHLNLALEGSVLEIEFASPAMNLLGFEHAARSDAERASVAEVRARLEQPLALFGVPPAAACSVQALALHGAPFEADRVQATEHGDIEARYRLHCSAAEELQGLNLAGLFGTFPATRKIQVQLIGPRGQQGLELSAERSALDI